jgi:hypothetical protein
MYNAKPNHLLLGIDRAKDSVFAKPASAILALVAAIFVAARFWHLTAYSLWACESFGLYGARQDWSGLISYAVADVAHPPLFYMLLKVWITIGGESLLWLKLLPVLIAIATMLPFLLLCRELNLRAEEVNLAFTLVAVNGYLIHFAQELRMYSLLMFLGVCSFWLFVRFCNSEIDTKRDLLALFAVNLLLVYTHYFGWLVVGSEFVLLLFWGRRKLFSFSLSVAILILCFSPWAYIVTQAAVRKGGWSIIDWIPRPNLFSLIHFYAAFNGPFNFRGSTYLRLLLFGYPVLLWGWHIIRGSQNEDKGSGITFWWLFLFSFLPIALVYTVSQFLPQSVWVERYFIFMAIPYMILGAMAVNRLRPNWARTAIIVFIVVWSTLAGFRELNSNRIAWEGSQLGSRITWDALAHQLIQAEPSQAGDIKVYALSAITDDIEVGYWTIVESLRFYLDPLNEKRLQAVYVPDVSALPPAARENHFWVAFFESRYLKKHPPQKVLEGNGYRVGEGFQFGSLDNRLVLFPVWRR